ncbi:Peptidoglycan/LPS O-acetylase OafA/YrhL, contains acyltransferase and SGNH-hydrolase domains [Pseudobutyrivibrio sp. ACV-2]|uniref:acyltransferase family protein n=1 Tax=Pseudobutyrivibrio sp. ACV-2 TaxID=1520801 RepID=UPI0008995380|nr:acyltransferase [Pseudobutyrivibrio sp. ACV-2]SEB00602.1 Peptidoglycan/LPS O-acetylase OafA/YrhL, contains acyltransferase and SGNH-hydrolase domains [Pseudobutyrivibrio sp. ACV-2]
MKPVNSKQKDKGIELIRALSALTIVIYHFGCHSSANLQHLVSYKNGSWGELAVNLFFMISGAVLYMSNCNIASYKQFFIKRAKAIYPMYWLVSGLIIILKIYSEGKIFYGPGPQLLTVPMAIAGLSGYFQYLIPGYELCGDWFLGAIILIYLLYPMVAGMMKWKPKALLTIVTALFLWVSFFDIFLIEPQRNLITCLFSFVIGMFMISNKSLLNNNFFLIVSGVFTTLQFFVHINFNSNVVTHFFAIFTFVIIYRLGNWVTSDSVIDKGITFIAGISYPMFLLQHAAIIQVTRRYNPTDIKNSMIILLALMFVIIIGAWIVRRISQLILALFVK